MPQDESAVAVAEEPQEGEQIQPQADAAAAPEADEANAPAPEATPEAKDKAGEAQAPALDRRLRHAAERMKWTQEQVVALGDKAPAVLSLVADGLDEISSRFAKLGQGTTPKAPKAAPTETAPQPTQTAPAPAPGTAANLGVPLQLDLAEYDEDTRKLMEPVIGYANAMREQVAAVQEYLPALQYLHQQVQQQEEAKMETFFQGIEADYGDIYGKGPTRALAAESKEFSERKALYETASAIWRGHQSQGQPVSVDDALQAALSMRHRERIMEKARKEIAGKVEARKRQVLPKPARQVTPESQRGDDRAVATASRKLKELGLGE